MNYVGSNLSLKYLRLTLLVCKDIGIRKSEFEFVTQFIYEVSSEMAGILIEFL